MSLSPKLCQSHKIKVQKKIGSITLQLLQIYGSNHNLCFQSQLGMPKGGLLLTH
jgi:hypothetical protein